jgi:23S rRNA (uracil1939-C5)-methyltransferase
MRARATAETVETEIVGHGPSGDGVAQGEGRRVFVPLAAPGDLVRIECGDNGRARLIAVIAPGADRVAPACGHFGACGGCALQHLSDAAYRDFTREQVVRALAQRGFADAPVQAPVMVAPGTRRRTALKAVRIGGRVALGLSERAGHRIVDLAQCPVLTPGLEAMLAPLRALAGETLGTGDQAELLLTESDSGITLDLRMKRPPALADRERLAGFAEAARLARVAWNGEAVVERAQPVMRWGGASVVLPAEPFVQATAAGERAMVDITVEAIGQAKAVADLFCGAGAFALPLSARARIDAFDADAAAVAALDQAARRASRSVAAARRDLFRRPLEPAELDRYDAVVLDPPHAGARAQAERLAACRVPVVVMASCNPATFARDARIMADGGYRLDTVTPIDQFRWSAETELVGVLRREGGR